MPENDTYRRFEIHSRAPVMGNRATVSLLSYGIWHSADPPPPPTAGDSRARAPTADIGRHLPHPSLPSVPAGPLLPLSSLQRPPATTGLGWKGRQAPNTATRTQIRISLTRTYLPYPWPSTVYTFRCVMRTKARRWRAVLPVETALVLKHT